jgi:hypothetical protein
MDFVNNFYETLHSNKYVSTILTTFLVIYGSMAAPSLPSLLKKLFNNIVFKVIVLSLIAYSVNKDPKLSVMLSSVFVIVLSLIGQQEFFEGFADHKHVHDDDMMNVNVDEKEEAHKSLCRGKKDKEFFKRCCEDFKTGEPSLTGKCLDKIEECKPGASDKPDFDYEGLVCFSESEMDEMDEYEEEENKGDLVLDNDINDEMYNDV